jgi:hypothetical protein
MGAKAITEVRELFVGQVPLIFLVMEDHGVLEVYWPLVRRCLRERKAIPEDAIIHALMVVLSTRCTNSYCFILHSYFLMGLGFTQEEIYTLVRELTIPPRIEGHARWGKIIQYIFMAQQSPASRAKLVKALRISTTPQEYEEIVHVCIAMRALNAYAEFFYGEVLSQEDGLIYGKDTQISLPIPDLISFYTRFAGNGSSAEASSEQPVAIICAECKRIKDPSGDWYALEIALPKLAKNTLFTHGFCVPCYERIEGELEQRER